MILVDTGPLVALVSVDDQHHRECTVALRTLRKPMGTVWPVLAETMHLLDSLPKAQDNVWEMIVRGICQTPPAWSG
jgi:predicted nucleic acid-binding protein